MVDKGCLLMQIKSLSGNKCSLEAVPRRIGESLPGRGVSELISPGDKISGEEMQFLLEVHLEADKAALSQLPTPALAQLPSKLLAH